MNNAVLSETKVLRKQTALEKLGVFLYTHADVIATVLIIAIIVGGRVFADEPGGGGGGATGGVDAMWGTIKTLIGKWVTKLGGVVMFVGGVMFGLGWKNEDADGKTRGVNTIISGAIVTAMAGMVDKFFL